MFCSVMDYVVMSCFALLCPTMSLPFTACESALFCIVLSCPIVPCDVMRGVADANAPTDTVNGNVMVEDM